MNTNPIFKEKYRVVGFGRRNRNRKKVSGHWAYTCPKCDYSLNSLPIGMEFQTRKQAKDSLYEHMNRWCKKK